MKNLRKLLQLGNQVQSMGTLIKMNAWRKILVQYEEGIFVDLSGLKYANTLMKGAIMIR